MWLKKRESNLAIGDNGVGTPVCFHFEIQQCFAEQVNELASWDVLCKVWRVLDVTLVEDGKGGVHQSLV